MSSLFLNEIFIYNFRNIKQTNLLLHPKKNLFYGKNGQGKTNMLEAISQISSLRAMQNLKLSDLVSHNEENAYLRALTDGEAKDEIEVKIFQKKKSAFYNQKPILRAHTLQKSFLVVSFIPEELNMIKGSPSLRRNALDQAGFSLYLEHYNYLKDYEKTLLCRNKILKNYSFDKKEFEVFTNILIEKASYVIFNRINTLNILNNFFKEEIAKILGQFICANIAYEIHNSNTSILGLTVNDIRSILIIEAKNLYKEECFKKQTLFGPHLDNINFLLNGELASKFSSRGQTKSLVLAFKLAQMKAIKKIKSISPLIILDDIFSELDEEKKYNILKLVDEIDSQCFFSSIDKNLLNIFKYNSNIYSLEDKEIFIK